MNKMNLEKNFLKEIAEMRQDDTGRSFSEMREAFRKKELKASDFSITKLFAEAFGWEALNDVRSGRLSLSVRTLKEAFGATTTADFQTATGEIALASVIEGYDSYPASVVSPTIPVIKARKINGDTHIGYVGGKPDLEPIDEGDPYPILKPSENAIRTPPPRKRGGIIQATKELIVSDEMGGFLDAAKQEGERLRRIKEELAVLCLIGADESSWYQHLYRWGKAKDGNFSVINTYDNNTGNHTWDNLATSNPLRDIDSIEITMLLAAAMTNPFNGVELGVDQQLTHIFVPPGLKKYAMFALGGVIQLNVGGYATSGDLKRTEIPNPATDLVGNQTVVSSQLIKTKQGNDTTWYMCNPAKAFACIEMWPLKVEEITTGSEDELKRDIVFQIKTSEMYTYATLEPRFAIKNTA